MSTLKGRAAILALWFLPDFIIRWLPPSFGEAVEREVYDGLTRAEWFAKSIREMQATPVSRNAESEKK